MMLKLDDEQLKLMDRMLAELPYKYAAPFVNLLNKWLAEARDAEAKDAAKFDNDKLTE